MLIGKDNDQPLTTQPLLLNKGLAKAKQTQICA